MTEPLIERLRRATIGRYDIYAELGSGGMATVFLALDLALDRKVAIKVLNPQLASAADNVARFQREAKVAAALDHPNIIGILAVGDDPELAYFVMKYVEGRSLDSVIAHEGAQSLAFTRSIIATTARALQYAHQRGVIHRDVKPANLMLDLDGRLIVTDFGIAKQSDATGLTITGSVIGTPYYMSPEQFNGLPVTGATDQYALGVVAFELLTGQQPYPGLTVGEVMRGHLFDPIPSVSSLRSEVPPALERAITRMLAKAPEERFPSLEEAALAIESLDAADATTARTQIIALAQSGAQQRPVIHVPLSPTPVARPRESKPAKTVPLPAPRRRRWPAVAALLLVLAVGAGAAYALRPEWFGLPPRVAAVAAAADSGRDSAPQQTPPPPAPKQEASPAPAEIDPAPRQEPVRNRPGGRRGQNTRTRDAEPADGTPAPAPAESTPTEPAPSPRTPLTGLVRIGSNVPAAILLVNGIPWPEPARGLKWIELPAGEVRLTIRTLRCGRWDSTITVVAGARQSIGYRPYRC